MNVLNNTDLIPIGTICYRAGSLNKCTEEIVVDNNNQKWVSMLWNRAYFSNKADADGITLLNGLGSKVILADTMTGR